MTIATPLDTATREALAELLLSVADDEFVIGFWDSEWTGIAPMLEEDVATSSIAQDEIGHARALYDLLATITELADPDLLKPPFDRSHKKPGGYIIKHKLHAAKERATGTAEASDS